MSWLKPIAVALLLGALTFLVTEGTSNALTIPNPFASCPLDPPTPSTPGTGISGSLAPNPPANSKAAPTSDIWAAYELPFAFNVYAPGCIAGNIQSPDIEAHVSTYFGNFFLGSAEVLVASGAAVHGLVTGTPSWLGIFSKLQQEITHALYLNFWGPFAPLSLLIVAIVIIFEARRANIGPAFRRGLLALGTIVLVVASATAGGLLARDVASGELGLMSAIDGAIGGSSTGTTGSAADLEVQSILYPAWLRGEVGSSTSSTAVTYGPQLLDGAAYTWSETPGGLPDPSTTSNKASEWNTAAASIKASDPSAYSDLTGSQIGRAGAGLEALIGTVVTVPFQLISDALTAASLLVVILALMVLPVAAVFGLHQRLEMVVKGVLIATAAGLLNATLFHTAAAIQTRATGFLFGQLPWWIALFFVALSIPILWVLTRPMRRLIHLPSREHNIAHEIEGALRRVKDGAVRVGATVTGGAAAGPAGAAAAAAAAGDVASTDWAAENQAARETRSTRKEGNAAASQSGPMEPQATPDTRSDRPSAAPGDRSAAQSQGPREAPHEGAQRPQHVASTNARPEPFERPSEPYGREYGNDANGRAEAHSNGRSAPEPGDSSEGSADGVRAVPSRVVEPPVTEPVGDLPEAVHDAAVGE